MTRVAASTSQQAAITAGVGQVHARASVAYPQWLLARRRVFEIASFREVEKACNLRFEIERSRWRGFEKTC